LGGIKIYNPKKQIKGFLKGNNKSIRIPYTGNRLNAMVEWKKIRNPLRTFFNSAISDIGKKIPSIFLKNSLYKIAGVKIGKDVAIGPNTFIEPLYPELLTIEDGVIMGGHCTLLCHEFLKKETILGRTTFKSGAMMGTNVVTRPGVTIGKNAVVGSLSFVIKDVPDNEFWSGVPAKFVKKLK
jgi:acetyltransferase-like isoleucine patch superfamily enzyme